MKLVNFEKENIYNKKINIELTVGELVILKVLSGDSNSNKIANELKGINSSHQEFAKEVDNNSLNTYLYSDLVSIHKSIFKREG